MRFSDSVRERTTDAVGMPCDNDNLTNQPLTREERSIYAQVSRRGFMGATAAATLSALAGREPRLVRGAATQSRPPTR